MVVLLANGEIQTTGLLANVIFIQEDLSNILTAR